MGWQQYVADVAGEYEPTTGLPAYQVVIVSVPRQSGKTTIELVVMLDRGTLWDSPQRMSYSAQTGQEARKKVINDLWPAIRQSPLRVVMKRLLRGAAETAMIFRNASRVEVLASADDAGHGQTLDAGFVDEAFADEDDRREQAMVPAMSTRPAAQLYVFSTQGTGRSVYFNRKVAEGRAAVETGQTSGIAYFEWSAPEDADPDDPATWEACMPALHRTISPEAVRFARTTMTDGEFRRAYLNQRFDHEERWIGAEAWAARKGTIVEPPPGTPITIGFDGSYNRDATALAGSTLEGHVFAIGLWERPNSAGPDWIVPRGEVDKRLAEAFGRWKVVSLVCDRSRWYDETQRWWETYGDVVKDQGTDRRRMVDACAAFYGAVMQGRLTHDGSADLTRHLGNAIVRETADGAYITKTGRSSSRKIDLAVAAVMAYREAIGSKVTDKPKPWVSFGGKAA